MIKYVPVFILVGAFFFSGGCSINTRTNFRTDKDLKKESVFHEFTGKGDLEFVKMHWMGWTNAIRFYSRAIDLKDSALIRENLFFAHLLRAVRSRFFYLSGAEDLDAAGKLLQSLKDGGSVLTVYYKIAKGVIYPDIPSGLTEEEIAGLRGDIGKDYKYFFYILAVSRGRDLEDYRKETRLMIDKFPGSNFNYFLRDIFIEIDKGIREFPDFIELLVRRADRFFATGKLTKAEEYYLRVLDYNKDIPFALTGLGQINLHYELYSKALDYFVRSEELAPLYYKILFGKAVCLSQMGEYGKSIEVLNIMINNELPYTGETFYYRAFNYFLLKEYTKVESDLKIAEEYIPESVELNTLFGMFYYETDRNDESRKYFNKVLTVNNKYPRPYYYLGFLDLRKNDIEMALKNFSMASKFYLEMINVSLDEINTLKDQDLPAHRLREVVSKRKKRIGSKINEIIQKINTVIQMFRNLEKCRIKFLHQTIKNLNGLLQSDPLH